MSQLDTRAFFALYGGSSGRLGWAMLVLTVVGGGWATLGLLPLAAWGKTRRLAALLLGAIVAQAVFVWALKLAVGRVRPWLALGLPPPFGQPHDGSFPSGHAAGSCCVAAFFVVAMPALVRPGTVPARLLPLALVTLAAFVCFSRVYLGAHFPGDVLAGAFVGALAGAWAGRRYAPRAGSHAGPSPRGGRGEVK
jgi:undecaprenyl-diphosphatase